MSALRSLLRYSHAHAIAGLLVLFGCAPQGTTTTPPGFGRYPGNSHAPAGGGLAFENAKRLWLALEYDLRDAYAADRAANYVEAVRLYLKVGSQPEAAVVFPGVQPDDDPRGGTVATIAWSYMHDIALARIRLSEHYSKGQGVPHDMTQAAMWRERANQAEPAIVTGKSPPWPGQMVEGGITEPAAPPSSGSFIRLTEDQKRQIVDAGLKTIIIAGAECVIYKKLLDRPYFKCVARKWIIAMGREISKDILIPGICSNPDVLQRLSSKITLEIQEEIIAHLNCGHA